MEYIPRGGGGSVVNCHIEMSGVYFEVRYTNAKIYLYPIQDRQKYVNTYIHTAAIVGSNMVGSCSTPLSALYTPIISMICFVI